MPGSPSEASPAITNADAMNGIFGASPPISGMILVWVRS
jgi:hypothetical protein